MLGGLYMTNQLKHFIRGIFFMYNWDYGVLLAFLLVLSVLFLLYTEIPKATPIISKNTTNAIIHPFLRLYQSFSKYLILV